VQHYCSFVTSKGLLIAFVIPFQVGLQSKNITSRRKENIEEGEGDRRLKKSRYADTFAHKLLHFAICNLQST